MKVIQHLRDSKTGRLVFTYLLVNMIFEIAQPTAALALTAGPSQPEVQSFEPVGTTDMVDVFTGDFNYNIPLMNIPGPNGGYPINLSYHAGISMDDEASWVGLGWNINSGALVRNVRGLPDDFNSTVDNNGDYNGGDFIERKVDQKESVTVSVGMGSQVEELMGGASNLDAEWQFNVRFNNYRGLGYNVSYSNDLGDNSDFQLGLSLDSEDGLGVNLRYSFDCLRDKPINEHTLGVGFNGNNGLNASLSKTLTSYQEVSGRGNQIGTSFSNSRSSSFSYSTAAFSPSIGTKMNSYNVGFSFIYGDAGLGFFSGRELSFSLSMEDLDNELKGGKRYPVAGYEKTGSHSADEEAYYTLDFTRQDEGFITRTTPVLGHAYYTHDYYNFTGQGIGGYFRGRRADIGRVHDPQTSNRVGGLNGSFELSFHDSTSFEFNNLFIASVGKKLGLGLNLTYGWNTQGPWNTHNDEQLAFQAPRTTGIKENVYYQVHGQPTVLDPDELDHINGESLYSPSLSYEAMERGVHDTGLLSDERTPTDRVVRNTLVHHFNNSELSVLPEFNSVRVHAYSDLSSNGSYSKVLLSGTTSNELDREERDMDESTTVQIAGHTGGYKVLNEDGSYYVYGLPAYNNKEVNALFSAGTATNAAEGSPVGIDTENSEINYQYANTDKFLHKTTQSPYAHSYMLTAIFGADYVDITQDGPTDDDMGYWVKFDYVKYADDYQWRAPYYGAFLNKGAHHTSEDDKASYTYGEKEVWYLGRIETKTHVAVYHLSERQDIAESNGEFTISSIPVSGAETGLKVDKISLYVKADYAANGLSAKPLQEVHFRYDYSLCPGVLNNTGDAEIVDGTNINEDGGKLTLKSIWFTAQGSTKGERNKYTFTYDSGDVNDTPFLQNPSYAFHRINGWGGYKPGSTSGVNKYFPYTDQFNQWPEQGGEGYHNDEAIFENDANKADFQRYQNQFASAWCLKKIELPSGGTIQIDYESDDYGYVQDQEATQMFRITDVNDLADGLDKLYDEGSNDFGDPRARRIYFKLEYPLADMTSNPAGAATTIYNQYVKNIVQDENGDRNLFFKSFVLLKDLGTDGGTNDYESVSGYLPLERELSLTHEATTYYSYGVSGTLTSGKHTHGFVTVQQTPKKSGGHFDYHPISLLAWQYMQTNTPKLMHDFANPDEGSTGNAAQQFTNLLNVVPAFLSSVGATRPYARARNYAKKIDPDRSVMRLCSPDKKKFGGGHRVRKISITDNWGTIADESDRTYGTEYDYTMQDEDGKTISSGVAQYEPSASGDENALKYPLHFHGKNTFVSHNNLFAEHPFNEDLFPGASVGYRRVSVKSSNTAAKIAAPETNTGRTGGVTVYQFYTAKDFPTITEYTPLTDANNDHKSVLNLTLPIPFIGSYTRKYYHASQGFKIELNDMHGRLKSVETFELTGGSVVNGNPITSTTYEYQTQEYIHNGNHVMRLYNKVRVVSPDSPTQLAAVERDMGVEYDLFTDQRQSKSHTVTAGGELNFDTPFEGISTPIPSFWPSFSTNKTLTRTYVTNKVIFKTGILKRTVTRDLQSSSSSEIVAYDERSGQPLVTKGTNEFGDELYSYHLPAYWHYDGMGHAYRNIDYTFDDAHIQVSDASTDPAEVSLLLVNPSSEMLNMLVRGDEILLTNEAGVRAKVYYADLTFDGSGNPALLCYAPNADETAFTAAFENYEEPGDLVYGRVIRSGRRNHYSTIAASYLTKGNVFDNIDGAESLAFGITTPEMDNVISASASVFRDDWNNSLTVNESNGELVSNPYLSGHSGIWRPYKTYTYAAQRGHSADVADGDPSIDPDLRTDGVMTDVPMFSWKLGNMEEYVPQWEWASEITRHNRDSYEVENVDRLGVHSAALFGLGNNLSLAVGSNADYHEIGAMDFESSTSSLADPDGLTNLIFFNGSPGTLQNYVSETVKIRDCYLDTDGSLIVKLDLPDTKFGFATYCNDRVGLGLTSRQNGAHPANVGHYLNGTIDLGATQSYTDDDGIAKVQLKVTAVNLANTASGLNYLLDGEHFYGRATFLLDRAGAEHANSTGVSFNTTKAHTGKKSMKLTANASFLQKELRLKQWTEDEPTQYVLSFWVSRDSSNVYRYTSTGSDLLTLSQVHPGTGAVTAIPSGTLKYTCSKVIDGWQKIDIRFSMNVAYGVLKLNFTPGEDALYVDDLRVSPHTGGITTNVYDPSNFRLRASLNADNYATFYYYDEQGNLVLRKQETEDGIVTLNEARAHVRKQ